MSRCELMRSRECERSCNTECFRCGLPACKGCSVVINYLHYGKKRIGLDCLDEMARFGELDYLTLAVQERKHLQPTPRMQLIALLSSIEGTASNISDGCRKCYDSGNRIQAQCQETQELLKLPSLEEW